MTSKNNEHVWAYLAYYVGLPHAPGFAVLLSGPWGVGKTYLLKAFLKKQFANDPTQYVYVSLYGLSTVDEIDDAMFQAAFPALTGTAAKMAGRVVKSGLKFLRVDPGDWNIKEFLNKFDAKVYVFDDLERCEAPINKALGYINEFVEHGGAKVIVLANETEIGKDEDYERRREKLIGRTLHVSSEFNEAFEHFASEMEHAEARKFIQDCAADIKTIYIQSALDNLRILKQTMGDFARFYAALTPDHRANKDAMTTLLRLLFVLSFELKAGRISEDDVMRGRGASARLIAALNKEKSKSPIALAGDRYPMVDIDDAVLSNAFLVDYLSRGIVDADAIQSELKASRFFVRVADEQPWQTVWHWPERSDVEFDAALAKMETQFKDRAFVKDGEILHVLGLRLLLSGRGVLSISKADVIAQGKTYIDDVYAAKTLELPARGDTSEVRFNGWGGLGIAESDTTEYRELFNHLTSTMQRAVEDTYPEIARGLLEQMKSDVQVFYRKISLSHADASEFVYAPVLAKLPVDDFVSALLSLHPSEQRLATAALKARYEGGRLDRDLTDEKPWILSIRTDLTKRSSGLSTISRQRLEMYTSWMDAISSPETPEPLP